MKRLPVEEILRQLREEDPDELLVTAMRQGSRLREFAKENAALEIKNKELRARLESCEAELGRKNQRVKELEEKLEEAQRASHRQAAPFRIDETKRYKERKKPGRKAGHPGSFRARPEVVDHVENVPLQSCGECGGTEFAGVKEIEQWIEEIPVVTRLTTYEGTCCGCGKAVCSTHPLQVSTATGSAGVHLGPRALAIACDLNKSKGITMRKTCSILQHCFGLKLSPGGLSQLLDRVADTLQPAYDTLGEELRASVCVHSDETSWWVGEAGWWLWVFTNANITYYQVDQSRGRQVVFEVLGTEFPGVLVSDCLSVYDDASPVQQKCYAHHLKAISQAEKIQPGQSPPTQEDGGAEADVSQDQPASYLQEVKALLQAAIALGKESEQCEAHHFEALFESLKRQAAQLLKTPRADPAEEKIRNRLFKQRDHLFTFLEQEGVDATNNLAERQLRPAVIARKVSCGNKTPSGARTWKILASLAATCCQRLESFIEMVAKTMPLAAR